VKDSVFLWWLWFAYWLISARLRLRDTDDSTVQREPMGQRLVYGFPLWGGFALLFWRGPLFYSGVRLLPSSFAWIATGLTLEVAGLGFTVWARVVLGQNWSGRIATGGNQQLVMHGPYQFVRHPIYTGILLALVGTTLVAGTLQAVVGLALAATGIFLKAWREETAVRLHFGSAYEDYARRVPALFPLKIRAARD
jgi:protein-S-isoprenylcysteine O-methyltransferase Ste14